MCRRGNLSLTRKVIVDILLGRDGHAVPRGWNKAPTLERRQHFVVNLRRKALYYLLTHDISLIVNRDFHHNVALLATEFAPINKRIGGDYGQCNSDLIGRRAVKR